MENLPTELLRGIFGLLSIADACNLRLTCKNHAEIGAMEVFSTVRLVESIKSYENHRKISEHKIFRDYVRKLEYEAAEPLIVEKMDWLRHIVPWQNQFTKKTDPDYLEDLIVLYEEYAKRFREVDFIHETGLDHATITSAFFIYPNLKSVSVTANYFQYLPSRSFKGGLSAPVPFEYPGSLDNRYEEPFVDIYPVGARSLKAVLSAAQVSGRELEELRVELVHINFFELDPMYPPPMYSRTFFSLKHLYLNVGRHSNFEMQDSMDDDLMELRGEEKIDTRVRYIGDLLGQIKGLESLGLSFGNESTFRSSCDINGEYGDNRIDSLYGSITFDKLTRGTTWPRLKRLELASMDIYGPHFLSFMERHASSLKKLHMKDVWLVQGDWTNILHNMRQKLSLNAVEFKGFFGIDYYADGRFYETVIPDLEFDELGDWIEEYNQPWDMTYSNVPIPPNDQEDASIVHKTATLGDKLKAWFLAVPGAEFPKPVECRNSPRSGTRLEPSSVVYYSGMLRPRNLEDAFRVEENHRDGDEEEQLEFPPPQHIHYLHDLDPYEEVLRRYPVVRPSSDGAL